MSEYLRLCVRIMEAAYAIACLIYLGLIGEAVILFSMSLVPGFV